VQTSIGERIKDCRFVAGIGAVATVPTGSGMVLIDRDQQAFPRPVSNPFAQPRSSITPTTVSTYTATHLS